MLPSTASDANRFWDVEDWVQGLCRARFEGGDVGRGDMVGTGGSVGARVGGVTVVAVRLTLSISI